VHTENLSNTGNRPLDNNGSYHSLSLHHVTCYYEHAQTVTPEYLIICVLVYQVAFFCMTILQVLDLDIFFSF